MVAIPSVHMNGDTKQTLIDQHMAVYLAAETLLDALREAGPNGRNFYPQGPDAMRQAQAEHHERLVAADKIRADMETIILVLQDG